jgi:hypothetical protein
VVLGQNFQEKLAWNQRNYRMQSAIIVCETGPSRNADPLTNLPSKMGTVESRRREKRVPEGSIG